MLLPLLDCGVSKLLSSAACPWAQSAICLHPLFQHACQVCMCFLHILLTYSKVAGSRCNHDADKVSKLSSRRGVAKPSLLCCTPITAWSRGKHSCILLELLCASNQVSLHIAFWVWPSHEEWSKDLVWQCGWESMLGCQASETFADESFTDTLSQIWCCSVRGWTQLTATVYTWAEPVKSA